MVVGYPESSPINMQQLHHTLNVDFEPKQQKVSADGESNRGKRPHRCNLTSTFFSSQTAGPRVTDFQPAVRDNGDLIGAIRSVPVS